jgi:hypothetical protein
MNRRLDLFIINRDEILKKYEYFAKLYLEVLNDQFPIIYSPDITFIQNNALNHTAGIIK